TFAPDGTLAFLSNRTGTNAIWIIKPGTLPKLLFDGGLLPLFRLEFSPDGKYLALPIAAKNGVTIDILTADGAIVTSFHSSALGGGGPTWTQDGKDVIALDRDKDRYMSIDIANPARRRPATQSPYGNIIFHKGATFAERFDKAGIWQIDRGPRLITGKYPFRWDETAALLGDELLVPDFDAAEGPRILAQPLAGGPDRVLAYAPGAQAQIGVLETKMAVNPKTGEIIYVAAVQSDTNIDLLTLAKH
ncbi:MAG: PD40 domain-containing protein, partial [Proteobacteria bacterium]|nr:PD40 domain-containing protein [Pseudomonadota bacterium]